MNTKIAQEKVKTEFVQECKEDYVGLWVLPPRLEDEGVPSGQVKSLAMQIISEALMAGDIVAGEFIDKKFAKWPCSPAESVVRIEREWEKLGRNLTLNDIAWFVARSDA